MKHKAPDATIEQVADQIKMLGMTNHEAMFRLEHLSYLSYMEDGYGARKSALKYVAKSGACCALGWIADYMECIDPKMAKAIHKTLKNKRNKLILALENAIDEQINPER